MMQGLMAWSNVAPWYAAQDAIKGRARMAGHSKWANIKHRKARMDAKRGAVFTQIVKKISSAARRGGGDLETNSELRLFVQKAKAANMPNDNIERAILKATGQLEGITYNDFTYEGYGPGGVAYLLQGATDNKNRTVGEIRHAFSKHGGNLGENGCVGWMFHSTGVLRLSRELVSDPDALMEVALEHGAQDFQVDEESILITSSPEDFEALRLAVIQAGFDEEEFVTDEITMKAETSMEPELEDVRLNIKIIDILEDLDDIEDLYHNLELSDEVAAALD